VEFLRIQFFFLHYEGITKFKSTRSSSLSYIDNTSSNNSRASFSVALSESFKRLSFDLFIFSSILSFFLLYLFRIRSNNDKTPIHNPTITKGLETASIYTNETILNSLTNIAKYNSRGINSGVVLFDKHIIKYFSEWLYDNLPYLLNIEDNNPILWRELGKYDQTIINIFIGENPKNMGNLNAIFNWRLNRCEYSNRWIATLIHYIIKINKHYLLEDYPNDRILK